jgi:hypothetical protein
MSQAFSAESYEIDGVHLTIATPEDVLLAKLRRSNSATLKARLF